MANKRNNSETSDSSLAYTKVAIGSARGVYRRFGTKVAIGRSTYQILFCHHLFYSGKSCEGLCDTVNKIIYVLYHKGDNELMGTTLLHEIIHASLSESCVTGILEWSDHMEEIIVESLSRDLSSRYSLNLKTEYKPS